MHPAPLVDTGAPFAYIGRLFSVPLGAHSIVPLTLNQGVKILHVGMGVGDHPHALRPVEGGAVKGTRVGA